MQIGNEVRIAGFVNVHELRMIIYEMTAGQVRVA
jgi:hypothetical protein